MMATSKPARGIRRFFLFALALALPIPVTLIIGHAVSSSLERGFQQRAEELVQRSWNEIEYDFRQIHSNLLHRAERIAFDPELIELLLDTSETESVTPLSRSVTRLFQSRYRSPEGITLELFDSRGHLVGWSGAGSLARPPPSAVRHPRRRTSIEDDAVGKALTVWVPVYDDGVQVGAVRASKTGLERTVAATPYLDIETLTERWQPRTPAGLEVDFSGTGDSASGADVFALTTDDGTQLGHVHIRSPRFWTTALSVRDRYQDVAAFWVVVLLIWLFTGLAYGLRVCGDRNSDGVNGWFKVAALVAGLWALRVVLMGLDVPARWFDNGLAQPKLFDPVFLASSFGWGAARSAGELLLTSGFFLATALVIMTAVRKRLPGARMRAPGFVDENPPRLSRSIVLAVLLAGTVVALAGLIAAAARRVILDSTLDYFAWTGLFPEPLVLVVFCSLILCSLSAIVLGASAVAAFVSRGATRRHLVAAVAAVGIPILLAYVLTPLANLLPWWLFLMYTVAMAVGALHLFSTIGSWRRLAMIRTILMWLLISTGLLYPLFYRGMDVQRRTRVSDRADEYAFRSDARVEEIIYESVSSMVEILADHGDTAEVSGAVPPPIREALESVLVADIQDVWLSVRRRDADQFRNYHISPGVPAREAEDYPVDIQQTLDSETDSLSNVIRVVPISDGPLTETKGYLATARPGDGSELRLVATRRHIKSPHGALFGYEDWQRQLSTAEFVDGIRVRTEGDDFERYTLPDEVARQLAESDEVWQRETVYGRPFLTFYRRYRSDADHQAQQASIVAVRTRAVIRYDHLYYLLRLALASLLPGIPLYLLGLVLRYQRIGRQHRTRFSDRVLDTFLGVGIAAVLLMGFLGRNVISRENEGAIRSRLERRLQRMENALVLRANPGEPLYAVLRRTPLDSLATELSLDLSVYDGPWLTDVSRNQEEALPLIGKKLPMKAFEDLYLQRFRQSFVESEGRHGYTYTIGYKALSDDDGHPQSVVAVLTIPEQARIREERARTTAYLFGTLLLLLLVIMATATVLAGALSRPIRRLRDGLEAVAQGKFQKPLPVPSRDEVGELVETFNVMQDQLVDSRRKLAQQQREMAWREMAKQVAHEIKNPLTPMKLSIQHLQRAFSSSTVDDPGRFHEIFRRITATLSEQIDTLANIANEFSTFARMPRRDPELLDANTIVKEAISLLQSESGVDIEFEPHSEPLVVNADRDELRRVYINLLKNASEAVGGTGKVSVRTRPDTDSASAGAMMLTEIVDTGSGIPSELQERIFEPNFSTKTSGMGLGLAIAKKSVEDMHGEIGFKMNEGRGTTFWIRLPLVPE